MFKQSVVLLSGLLSASAFAQWTLDQDNSALHFMSTKNAQVTEVHSFDHFSGKLSDSGTLTIEVPLDSVNTNIPIRNTRMQEMLLKWLNTLPQPLAPHCHLRSWIWQPAPVKQVWLKAN